MRLFETISNNPNPDAIRYGWVNQAALFDRIHQIEESNDPINDEQILTFLCIYGYAIGSDGPQELARVFLEDENVDYSGSIWFEFLPISPRQQEGETHLDIALGSLGRREGTLSGLTFDPTRSESWISFVEAKLSSDISYDVANDPFRNQLLRVIENAATLQDNGHRFPNRAHVVLLTPALFANHPRTRFYGCKFEEYSREANPTGTDLIEADLNQLDLATTHRSDWQYPESIHDRLERLTLHWITFEDVIKGMPDSVFRNDLIELLRRPGGLVGPPN